MVISKTELAEIFIAANNLDAMVQFYSHALDIPLEKVEMGEFDYYSGNLSGIEFNLVPNSVARVSALENKTLLKLRVSNLTQTICNVVGFGGKKEEEHVDESGRHSVHVRDPDGNSIELIAQT